MDNAVEVILVITGLAGAAVELLPGEDGIDSCQIETQSTVPSLPKESPAAVLAKGSSPSANMGLSLTSYNPAAVNELDIPAFLRRKNH